MPASLKNKYQLTALLLCSLFLHVQVQGQSAHRIEKRADAAFERKDYYAAAKMYSAILYDSPLLVNARGVLYPFQPRNGGKVSQVKKSRRNEVTYKLAEAYRLYNHPKEALPQYEKYVASQDATYPLARLWHGYTLIANNQPEKAIESFKIFQRQYKAKDDYQRKAAQGIASANFVIANRTVRPDAVVTKLPAAASSDGSNFGMERIGDSIIWFTSSRHVTDAKGDNNYPVGLYATTLNGNSASRLMGFSGDLNMATPSVTSDGLTMYFTGWTNNRKTGTSPYHIYVANRAAIDSPWRKAVELPAAVNNGQYNSKQPFIVPDGSYLFYASDQPGGKGMYDIWMVAMNGKEPVGRAFNLESINTGGDDVTPYYDQDSAMLYFSSDGRPGMGGLDIYRGSGTPAHNTWSAVTNLGAPLNSVRDDQYYRKDKNNNLALLSSDRASSCCLEIFKAVAAKYVDTSNKKPVLTAPLVAREINTDSLNKRLLDSLNAITLQRNYVHYDFASSAIRKRDKPILDSIIKILMADRGLNLVVASFTDCVGRLDRNIRIARLRSESVKRYMVEHGVDSSRVNIDFFGKQHFILPCAVGRSYNMAEQIANRRSDLIVTREKNPKWRPAGNELDIDKGDLNPLYRSVNTNFDDRSLIKDRNTTAETAAARPSSESGRADARLRPNTNNEEAASERKRKARVADSLAARKTMLARNTEIEKDNTARSGTKYTAGTNKKQPKANAARPAAEKQETAAVRSELSTETMRQPTGAPVEKIQVNRMLDFTPRVNTGLVGEMTKRIPRKPLLLYSTSDSVRIDLYDNGVFDGDTVSVIYNKQLVSYKQLLLTNKPVTFYVKLKAEPAQNEMILFAENLGLTPPNSALMVITDGDKKRTEVNVTSDLEHNTVIYFIKVKREKQ